jgi:histidinol-phosphate aminotransferase
MNIRTTMSMVTGLTCPWPAPMAVIPMCTDTGAGAACPLRTGTGAVSPPDGAGAVPPGAGEGLSFHGDSELAAGLVDMAVNVRHGAPPPWLAERIQEAVTDIAAYPDPRAATEAVARRHARPPAEVLVTAGAAEAFTLIARAFRPRRAAVVHPQFTEPEAALLAAGHPVDRVMLGGAFLLGPGAVPADADLVVVGNPTNPTSVLHPATAITALARPGRLLVVDEAFADCVPGEPESLAGARGIPGLIVVRSLTKTWGLAGLRAGYVLAGAAQVAAMARVRPPWAVSSPALAAVAACCEPRAREEAAAWADQLITERERLARTLNGIPGVVVTPRARASFLLLNIAGRGVRTEAPAAGGHGVRERLREAGFAVRRGDTFPGLGPDWLRVAVRDRVTNDRFATALRQIMEG